MSPTGRNWRPSRRSMVMGAAIAMAAAPALAAGGPSRAEVVAAMKRATRFMVEKVSVRGGYVWSYLPDFSRRWGEMEAKPSMIWTQAPGTPEMGQVFLDAYHLTGDEQFYQAAAMAADALVAGQHPSGGWNYIIDFGGEESIRDWYATVGRNGWRLEEFQHYYGNATFDDHATIECARLLLRLVLEGRDDRYRAPLEKAIGFVLQSQYPVGGWPQRWPRAPEFRNHGHPDYTGHITFNDEVAIENVDFLLTVWETLGDQRVLEPVRRAMECFRITQHGQPTPGWSLQYTPDLKPAGARTYEPRSIATHTTAANVGKLMDFYQLTGDARFLERIPEALDWLESVVAPKEAWTVDGRTHFTHFEPETNRPLFVRRRGSNAQNGEYYVNYDPTGKKAERRIDAARLRARYERLRALPKAEAVRGSVLLEPRRRPLPRYVVTHDIVGSDLNAPTDGQRSADASRAAALIAALNAEGYWPSELRTTSHPYRGEGPPAPPPGFVDRGQVGDEWDTSPFTQPHGPSGISTALFIRNMSLLTAYADGLPA